MAINTVLNGSAGPHYEGAVIQLVERNGYDDSDFYAVVEHQNEDGTHSYKHIEYASTRYPSSYYSAKVDATDEVLARYKAHMARVREKALAHKADIKGHTPAKGMAAYVTGGRKHKGKSGKVFWAGDNQFARISKAHAEQIGMRQGMGIYDIDLDCRTNRLRVGIVTDEGEKFFITGDKVDCFMDPRDDIETEGGAQ